MGERIYEHARARVAYCGPKRLIQPYPGVLDILPRLKSQVSSPTRVITDDNGEPRVLLTIDTGPEHYKTQIYGIRRLEQ